MFLWEDSQETTRLSAKGLKSNVKNVQFAESAFIGRISGWNEVAGTLTTSMETHKTISCPIAPASVQAAIFTNAIQKIGGTGLCCPNPISLSTDTDSLTR